MGGGVLLLVEYNLRQPRAVAQINKNQVAEIAPPMDPSIRTTFLPSSPARRLPQ